MANEEKKPWFKRPLVLVSIGTGFVGLMAGGYWLYKRSKQNSGDNMRSGKSNGADDFDQAAGQKAPELPSPNYAAPVTAGSSFPLKKGSRGELVKNLQNAIIQKYGATALPRYGADGDWGNETQKFFDAHPELKPVIDNSTYTDYVTGNFGSKTTGSGTATKPSSSTSYVTDLVKAVIPSWVTDPYIKVGFQLFDAAKAKNINTTITLLQKLNNVNDYNSASQGFQMRPYEPPFRKYTLVTGLFDSFKGSAEAKTKIREQLRRIGLKETVKNSDPANYDSTWSLSGIGSSFRNVRTKMKAIITDGFNIRIEIPARTLLGRWNSSGNGYTRFRTFDGRMMYVRTNAIVLE